MRARVDRVAAALFGALVVVGYVVVSRAAGELYPFSPLSMFSGRMTVSSRIVVRRANGELVELRDWVGWSCDAPADFGPEHAPACGRDAFHAENDRLAADWILAHGGEGGESVEVVRRVFRVAAPGAPVTTTDCALLRCSARREVGR